MDCHIISLVADDYDTPTSLLTDSDEEQIVFVIDTTPPDGTQSGN